MKSINTATTVTSYNDDVTRNTFNLMIWAQFELQAGIICASAPALRVFFRRYLGGGGGGNEVSRRSRTNASGTITVIRDTTVTFDKDGSVVLQASEKKQFYQLRDVSTPVEEDGEDYRSPSRVSDGAGEPLTRYSHDGDEVGLSRVGQFPWSSGPAGRSGGGGEKVRY
jgi:hypothetical protein